MNTLVHVAGWTLVHFAWQGAVIGLAAVIALRVLRKASPQSRYAVSCIALAAMVASPAATAWRLASVPEDVPIRRALFLGLTSPATGTATHDTLLLVRRHGAAVMPVAWRGTVASSRPDWPTLMPALVATWLAGVCLLLARLAVGWWHVRRLQAAARALASSSWQAAGDRIGARLGLTQLIRVVDASFIDSPVVIGWLRPVVLLPVAAVAGLTPEQVDAILAHELAHVRRHDAVVNLLQAVAETLLFYHPAVWWVSSRIRTEREHCCDDIALEMTGDAFAYASALAELESWRSAQPALALAATGGSLVARVSRLLGAPSARPARGGATITVALVLAFVVVAGGLQLLVARQPARVAGDTGAAPTAPAWRMIFDLPTGQMVIRGFTARDLVRYAYQVPLSQVVGGPAWLDAEAFELATTVDHVPAADETPDIVRQLLEDRFALRVHESTTEVPVLALQIARPDGALGPNLHGATGECFDQHAWVAAGAPRQTMGLGQATITCGVWDSGIAFERVRSISIEQLAAALHPRFGAMIRRDVVDRTGLPGLYDVSLEFFKPAAAAMAVTPAMRMPLSVAGFVSLPEALETQLGLTLVPSTAPAPAIVIDDIRRPFDELRAP